MLFLCYDSDVDSIRVCCHELPLVSLNKLQTTQRKCLIVYRNIKTNSMLPSIGNDFGFIFLHHFKFVINHLKVNQWIS